MLCLDCLKTVSCSRWRIQFRRCNARVVTDVQLVPMSLQFEKIAGLGENMLKSISRLSFQCKVYIVVMPTAIFTSIEKDCKGESRTQSKGLTSDNWHKRWFGRLRGMHIRIN